MLPINQKYPIISEDTSHLCSFGSRMPGVQITSPRPHFKGIDHNWPILFLFVDGRRVMEARQAEILQLSMEAKPFVTGDFPNVGP
jgi:hypothetical protein